MGSIILPNEYLLLLQKWVIFKILKSYKVGRLLLDGALTHVHYPSQHINGKSWYAYNTIHHERKRV